MLVGVGSTRPAKLDPVRTVVLHYFGENATVIGLDVEHGTTAQPLGHEETMQGAISRAEAVLKLREDVTIAVGIESGVVPLDGNAMMISYFAIHEREQKPLVTCNAGILLPPVWNQYLQQGMELRPLMQQLGHADAYEKGIIVMLTDGTVSRASSYEQALYMAFAPIKNRHYYQPQ